MTQWCIYWLGISSITRPPFSGSSQEQYLDFSLKHWREHPPLVLRPTFVRWSSSNATVTLRLVRPRRPLVRGKRSIPTILRKKRELWTIYCASVLPLSQSEEKTLQLYYYLRIPDRALSLRSVACVAGPVWQALVSLAAVFVSSRCLTRDKQPRYTCFQSQHYPRQARST